MPIVFDNLIRQQAMPVTIAVFVNPGTVPATKAGGKERSNRSFEYDSLGDRYANFLVDEFLPVALKGLNVSKDPQDRAVCGISSGGICAFTVAWEKPEQFGKVLSHIGSLRTFAAGRIRGSFKRKTTCRSRSICRTAKTTSTICTAIGRWKSTWRLPCNSGITLGSRTAATAAKLAARSFDVPAGRSGDSSPRTTQCGDQARVAAASRCGGKGRRVGRAEAVGVEDFATPFATDDLGKRGK